MQLFWNNHDVHTHMLCAENPCRTGYDGKKVDVWAAGVLLFVMLAGVFPFETQDDNFNNTAGLYDIWLQQIKTSWYAVYRVRPFACVCVYLHMPTLAAADQHLVVRCV